MPLISREFWLNQKLRRMNRLANRESKVHLNRLIAHDLISLYKNKNYLHIHSSHS